MDIKKFLGWHIKGIRRKYRSLSRSQKKMLAMVTIALLIGGFLGNAIGRGTAGKASEKEIARVTAQIEEREEAKREALQKKLNALNEATGDMNEERPWYMVLVNGDNPMEEGYVPELTELEPGYSVDTRIAKAAKEMLADAKAEGLHVIICSAYRSVERQENVFSESMKSRIDNGMDYWDAFYETSQNVALPGTSEHALGLALDLISNQYTELDERQEHTREAKWLAENCHKYGFILRYPPEKTEITGIIYEPWHYRYVGVEDATKIMQMDVTLEEYLAEYYQP